MNAIIKALEDDQLKKDLPVFKTGDVVRVSVRIKEGERERLQMFEGVVMKRQNGGVRETFTVRRLSHGVGVERTWPVHSPNVADIEVIRPGQVRRAKLNYLRDRIGKNARVKELIR